MRKIISIILLISVVISMFAYLYNKRGLATLSSNMDAQEESMRKFEEDMGLIPGAPALKKLEEAISLDDKEIQMLQSIMDSKNREVPLDVSDKSIYFFESLYATTKALERKASAKKMIIPAVNFSVDIPQEEDIPYLLKQVEMIDHIANIIIDAGNCEIEAIVPSLIDRREQVLDFHKLSIKVSMQIEPNSFVKVLFEINNQIPLYLIEELFVKTQDIDRLKVSFVVTRIVTNSTLSDAPELEVREIQVLDKIYPLGFEFKKFSERNPFFEFVKAAVEVPGSAPAQVNSSNKDTLGPQFTFKGSMSMGDKMVGIIHDNWNKNTCFAGEGDICSGYQVSNVEEKKVILLKDDQELEVAKGASSE
ncbi:hypothetical protein ACFL2J_03395 [Candidatus Omnitrophota bacterium]